jgi:hypothetical protein
MNKMKNLPEGMIPDRDNVAYYDTEKEQFYKMERKTHPSFLRGWDVSDKDSELTL